MKKALLIAALLVLVFAFVSCNEEAQDPADNSTTNGSQVEETTIEAPVKDVYHAPEEIRYEGEGNDRKLIVKNGYPSEQYMEQQIPCVMGYEQKYTVADMIKETNQSDYTGFFLIRARKVVSESFREESYSEEGDDRVPVYTITTIEILDIYESTKAYESFKVGDTMKIVESYGFSYDEATQKVVFDDTTICDTYLGSDFPKAAENLWEFMTDDGEFILMFANPYYTSERRIAVHYKNKKSEDGNDFIPCYFDLITEGNQYELFLPNLVKKIDIEEYNYYKDKGSFSFFSHIRGWGPMFTHYDLANLYMEVIEKYFLPSLSEDTQ